MPAIDVRRVGERIIAGILAPDEFLAQPLECFGTTGTGCRPIGTGIRRRPRISVRYNLRLHVEGVLAEFVVRCFAHFVLQAAGLRSLMRFASSPPCCLTESTTPAVSM